MFDRDRSAVALEQNVGEQHAERQRLFALGRRRGADVFGERADARRFPRVADADAAELIDIRLNLALGFPLADARRQDVFEREDKLRLVDEGRDRLAPLPPLERRLALYELREQLLLHAPELLVDQDLFLLRRAEMGK